MQTLADQLQQQQQQSATQIQVKDQAEAAHLATVQKWQRHCEGLQAEKSLLASALPPPAEAMDQAEKETRRSQAARSAAEADQLGADMPPTLAGILESAGANY